MDFFIAYHAADRDWADWIAAQLTAAGYSVELQSWDYWANSNLVLEMFAVSAIAEATIALLSPEFLAENLQRPEWAAAYAQDPGRGQGHPVSGKGTPLRYGRPIAGYPLPGLDRTGG